MIYAKRLAALTLTSALAACTVGPNYQRPQVSLTEHYAAPAALTQPDAQWWRAFGDPVLDGVVSKVLAQNLDLAAAAARIDQARAAAGFASAALLPSLSAGADAEADKTSLNTPFGAASHELGFPRNYEQYDLGARASWEIDLFGGLRRGREAARAELGGAVADGAAVRLSITAEAVDAYLHLRGDQARLAVAEQQRDVRAHLVDLIADKAREGVAADRDLHRARGDEEAVEAAIPPLRAAIAGESARLDVLMGEQAGVSADGLAQAAAIPAAPEPSGSAEPAELMRRRPDIVVAERRLAAANARIGVAVAEYYPHITLTGLLGFASVGGSALLSGNSEQASGGAALRWRLFDFGRVDAEVAGARGRDAEALAQYRASVLRATGDVETALVALSEGRREVTAHVSELAELTRARDQAQAAYDQGAVALLDVLDADRALLEASDRLASARAGVARASVAATRALGGGYEEEAHHG